METALSLLGWVFLALAAIFKAISPIATTAIAERHKTERARIKSPRNAQAEASAPRTTITTSPDSDSIRRNKADRLIGLLSSLVASVQMAYLYFGPERDNPLTVGVVVFIAQALVLYAQGGVLLSRR